MKINEPMQTSLGTIVITGKSGYLYRVFVKSRSEMYYDWMTKEEIEQLKE